MHAVLPTAEGTMPEWVLIFERIGYPGSMLCLFAAMVWYLRRHLAAFLRSKVAQTQAITDAIPAAVKIGGALVKALERLGGTHAETDNNTTATRHPIWGSGSRHASDGGASRNDLSQEDQA